MLLLFLKIQNELLEMEKITDMKNTLNGIKSRITYYRRKDWWIEDTVTLKIPKKQKDWEK